MMFTGLPSSFPVRQPSDTVAYDVESVPVDESVDDDRRRPRRPRRPRRERAEEIGDAVEVPAEPVEIDITTEIAERRRRMPDDEALSPFGRAAVGGAVGAVVGAGLQMPGGAILSGIAGVIIGYYWPFSGGKNGRR